MKILMVCLGNICRSPLAEGVLASKLNDDFQIESAGTISMHEGKQPDKRSIKIAEKHGIDISSQRSRPITKTDLQKFDKIFCMDLEIYKDVISLTSNEEQKQKVSLFLEAAGQHGENIEVPDPYWGDMNDFENIFQMIDKASEKIAMRLLK